MELRSRRQLKSASNETTETTKSAPDSMTTLKDPASPKMSNKRQVSQTSSPDLFPANDKGKLKVLSNASISWVVSKWAILRLTGVVYFIAFMGAYYQNPGLMGSNGLQPAKEFFDLVIKSKYKSPYDGFMDHPSVFWFVDLNDDSLLMLYCLGMTLSGLVVLGIDSMVAMLLLWLLYFSIVTTAGGNSFYNYGWESQLLETGFLCIFLCDLFPQFSLFSWRTQRHIKKTPPSPIILWLFRWLCFRIAMGAGLIKIRGDSCWTQKTCLHYHFETQPIPSPLSFAFHFLPKWMLTRAVDLDLFVQVYTCWMVLCPTWIPRSPRLSALLLRVVRIGGFIQAGFMFNIILSGNFAFLNHLTIIPALACLDDACWPQSLKAWIQMDASSFHFQWRKPQLLRDLYLLWLIGTLSRPVVDNLLQIGGKRQQMNASFGSFRLVNTYGAFGSVGQGRYEPIVSITYNGEDWTELEFPCKPGKVTRRPCFCAPYHYRADWNIWFVGFKPHERMLHGRESWLFALVKKLLDKTNHTSTHRLQRPWLDLFDTQTATTLQSNYEKFKNPLYVKVDMYHYKMAAPLWDLLPQYLTGKQVVWWKRDFEEVLIPPVEYNGERNRLVAVPL